MVARRGRHQSTGLFLLGECADFIVGSPDFIRASDLHILRFDVNMISCGPGKGVTVHKIGGADNTGQYTPGFLKFF